MGHIVRCLTATIRSWQSARMASACRPSRIPWRTPRSRRLWAPHVFDLGLQLAAVLLADLATEDDRDLVRLADGAVGVEQALAELIESGSPIKDQVVAEFDLREEQPVLTAALALSVAEE